MDTNTSLFGIYEPLTDEQNAKVNELYERVKDVEVPASYKWSLDVIRTLFLAKFLYARKWVVEDAAKMFTEAAAFRIEKKFEEDGLFPAAIPIRGYDQNELKQFSGGKTRTPGAIDKTEALFKCCASAAWHKWDKFGRVVYIERMGVCRTHELVARLKTLVAPGQPIHPPAVELHLHQNEVGGCLLRYKNTTTSPDKWQFQITAVADLAGLGMKNLYGPAMDVLKQTSAVDQRYYPEGLAKMYCVNASTVVSAFWAIVKGWIDPRVQKKVIFLKPHETAKGLLEVIDEEHLPDFLGGKCKCDGQCVPDLDDVPEGELTGTEELVIKAGKKETRTLDAKKDQMVVYEVAVSKNDVTLNVSFKPEGANAATKIATKPKMTQFTDGDFTLPCDGTVIFEFDNSHSWMKSKTVQFRTSVSDAVPEPPAEEQQ